jgi:site-specific DNA-methyltransferase (adenine-specific)
MFYNVDCIEGAKKYLRDDSVDLIVTDPPYGINGDTLHKHYNRDESMVLEGYVEVPAAEYSSFSKQWIAQAHRVLKPGGAMYLLSGYTNLVHILNALNETPLRLVNHIIWKYNFGVYTKTKYISSHYHVLYCVKPGRPPTFHTFCRYSDSEKQEDGGSANYMDREDVWTMNREYKPGQVKNKNELPTRLLTKIIQYSSSENDLVCDFFLGSFATAKVAIGLNRRACGFEISKEAFTYQTNQVAQVVPGSLLGSLRKPAANRLVKQGQPLGEEEKTRIKAFFDDLRSKGMSKKDAIEDMIAKFGRGYWSLLKAIDGTTNKKSLSERTDSSRQMAFSWQTRERHHKASKYRVRAKRRTKGK